MHYPALPFSEKQEEFSEVIAAYGRAVIGATMGSGKTTLVGPWLVEIGAGRVLVVVPRRILAMRAAERVAPILSSVVGERVGYIIHGDHRAHPRTEITFVTEGIFKLLLQHDLWLRGFGAVLFDEAHEQGSWSTVFQGLIKTRVLPERPNLLVGIMSGTLDETLYPPYWEAPLVSYTGRGYPLDILHEPDMTVRQAVAYIISGKRKPATILVFQPGYAELRECAEDLGRFFPRAEVLEMYGDQELSEQQRAFTASQGWRIVVATNVAESGLTIDGIHYVVDTGTEQVSVFDQELGVWRLETVEIGQRSADQRANRAGRLPQDGEEPDIAIRLWSTQNHEDRPLERTPEIQRSDLAPQVLWLRSIGVEMRDLDLLYRPPADHLRAADETLLRLGAVKSDFVTVTEDTGRAMLGLPIDDVRLAKAVLLASASENGDNIETVLSIAALQGVGRSLFVRTHGSEERKAAQEAYASLRRMKDRSDLALHLRAFERLQQLEYTGRLHQEAHALYLSPRAYLEAFALREQLDRVLRTRGLQWSGERSFSADAFVRVGLPALLGHLIVKDGGGRWRLAGPLPVRVILGEESGVDQPEARVALAQLRGLAPSQVSGASTGAKSNEEEKPMHEKKEPRQQQRSPLLATAITTFDPQLLLDVLPGTRVERTRYRYDEHSDAVLCEESWLTRDEKGQVLFLFSRTAPAPACEEALWQFASALAAGRARSPAIKGVLARIEPVERQFRKQGVRPPDRWRERLALWFLSTLREQGGPLSVRELEGIALEMSPGEALAILGDDRFAPVVTGTGEMVQLSTPRKKAPASLRTSGAGQDGVDRKGGSRDQRASASGRQAAHKAARVSSSSQSTAPTAGRDRGARSEQPVASSSGKKRGRGRRGGRRARQSVSLPTIQVTLAPPQAGRRP